MKGMDGRKKGMDGWMNEREGWMDDPLMDGPSIVM